MTPHRIAAAVLGVSLLASTTYLFVYLAVWEWHRAIVAGLFTVLALVGLFGTAVLDRLGRTRPASRDAVEPVRDGTLETLRRNRPAQGGPFRWLDPRDTAVFIPVLLGAGVLLSGLGWLVERFAGRLVAPLGERRLADRLSLLAVPPSLFDDDATRADDVPAAFRPLVDGHLDDRLGGPR